LVGATARDREKAERFLERLGSPAPFLSLDDLVEAASIVVEASTQKHLEEIAPKTLKAGRDLVVLSCGGLLGRQDWVDLAAANHCRILVPSGAIAGLDGVKGARIGAITSVTMESRKPPRGLAGAPWIAQQRIDLDAITSETLIFEGPATDACRAFPANVLGVPGGGVQPAPRLDSHTRPARCPYLTLPAVRPPTRWRSMSAKSTTTGTIVMIDAAKSEFQCWTYAVTYEVIPTVSGRLSGSVMRVRATMYSFHAAMNAKIPAVTTPGSDSGSTIRTSTRRRPHPSTAAASSISRGMEAKNARRIQMAKARLNAALVRM